MREVTIPSGQSNHKRRCQRHIWQKSYRREVAVGDTFCAATSVRQRVHAFPHPVIHSDTSVRLSLWAFPR